jgi:hypothetical protein
MTPQEAIDFLVERVGHERRNATAEIRRSFATSYSPLYQAAYMLGGLQLRALHKELVDSGRMTNRQFHDAVLKENSIPIDLIRASLTKRTLTRDDAPRWRFYDTNHVEKTAASPPPRNAAAGKSRDDAKENAAPLAARPKVYRDRIEPHWFAANNKFWYRVDLPEKAREFVAVDATAGTRRAAFDHERLARSLSVHLSRTVQPDRLPLDSIKFSDDGKSVRLVGESVAWQCDLDSYQITDAAPDSSEEQKKAADPSARKERRQNRSRSGPPATRRALASRSARARRSSRRAPRAARARRPRAAPAR